MKTGIIQKFDKAFIKDSVAYNVKTLFAGKRWRRLRSSSFPGGFLCGKGRHYR